MKQKLIYSIFFDSKYDYITKSCNSKNPVYKGKTTTFLLHICSITLSSNLMSHLKAALIYCNVFIFPDFLYTGLYCNVDLPNTNIVALPR